MFKTFPVCLTLVLKLSNKGYVGFTKQQGCAVVVGFEAMAETEQAGKDTKLR